MVPIFKVGNGCFVFFILREIFLPTGTTQLHVLFAFISYQTINTQYPQAHPSFAPSEYTKIYVHIEYLHYTMSLSSSVSTLFYTVLPIKASIFVVYQMRRQGYITNVWIQTIPSMSRVAQWKSAGPITQRSVVWTLPLPYLYLSI